MKITFSVLLVLSVLYVTIVTTPVKWLKRTSLKSSKNTFPLVSFTFDDGYRDQYQYAVPVLDSFGIRGTFYIITKNLKKIFPGYMDSTEVHNLYRNGHEIGSHTVTHPYILSYPWNAWQVRQSKRDLEQMGIKVQSFAYPYGRSSFFYRKKVVFSGYSTARVVGNKSNEGDIDPFEIRSRYVLRTTTISEIEKWIEDAEKNNAWLVLCFHHIDMSNTPWGCTPQMVRSISELIDRKQIKVLPITEAWKLRFQE